MTAPVRVLRRSSPMVQGSVWIVVALGLQSALGFAFWLLASRVADPDQLGRASALYTGVQFVNYASGLGLTVALARFAVDGSREADARFGWGVVATVASSVVGGCLFLAATAASPSTQLVGGSVLGWAAFCLATAGMSVGLLADVRLIARGRWGVLVGRIVLTGLVRLLLLPFAPDIDPAGWLAVLVLAPLAIGGAAIALLLPRFGAGRMRFDRPTNLGSLARYSGANWVATLASQGPQFVLPLVVAQALPAGQYANFFLAWTVTGLVLLVPGSIAQVLLVEGAKHEDAAGRPDGASAARSRDALVCSLVVATVAVVAAVVAGPLLAAVLGDGYRSAGRLLPALMAAGIPWALCSVRLAEARLRRDQVTTVAVTALLGAGIVVPAVVLVPTHGAVGAVVAWWGGNVAAAVLAVALHRQRGGLALTGGAA